MSASVGGPTASDHISIYTVEAGDTLSAIAHRFDISRQTIIWSNPELARNPDLLQIGQELVILPVDGAYHVVKEGDTLWDLAQRYGVTVEAIIEYPGNSFHNPEILTLGQELIIPGATRRSLDPPVAAVPRASAPQQTQPSTTPANAQQPAAQATEPPPPTPEPTATQPPPPANPAGGVRFIWPARGTLTQGFSSRHTAIDIAAPTGTPVVAAASGIVSYAGWQRYGYGNLIIIDHADGFQTYYAHMNTINVQVGQWVNQGDYIGGMGATGRATGSHVHFEVRRHGVPHNPLIYLP